MANWRLRRIPRELCLNGAGHVLPMWSITGPKRPPFSAALIMVWLGGTSAAPRVALWDSARVEGSRHR